MAIFKGYTTIDKKFGNTVLEDIELAKRDLMNHFYTRRGERLGQPEFGSIIPELVFEPIDEFIIDLVQDDVKRIVEYDSRWELLDLDIDSSEHTIECVVSLRYISTTTDTELYLKFTTE